MLNEGCTSSQFVPSTSLILPPPSIVFLPTLTKLPRSVLGDLTNGCNSSALHYNPHNVTHGDVTSEVRHVGDLGNILSDDQGVALLNITSDLIRLDGRFSVLAYVLFFPYTGDGL